MAYPGGIDDATLKAIIDKASRYQLLKRKGSSTAEVIAIAEELGIDEASVRHAMRELAAEKQRRAAARRPKLIAASVALGVGLLIALSVLGGDAQEQRERPATVVVAPPQAPLPNPTPKPQLAPSPEPRLEPEREPDPEPKPVAPPRAKPTDEGPSPVRISGAPKLKAKSLRGTWHLKSYQMAMDGRSVEVPLRHDPQGLHAERETWTLRADGTFTHRFNANLWFSGKWRLGGVAQIPDPLRPSRDLEVVHLITEEVTTSMMKQRPIEHHLLSLTPGEELITWYAGQAMPTLRALKQGHRFERVSP